MDIVASAQDLADEVLFPAALQTDAADAVPVAILDALADAGLYGLAGPASAGGLEADFSTVCRVCEALSSGCLTTAFVWAQHLGTVHAAASSENAPIREWLRPLCSGERRAGLALGGAVPGPPALIARPTDDGWIFEGTSPFVSGWGRIDIVHTAARTEDGKVVWAFVDAREGQGLAVEPLRLAALNATATVRADFRAYPIGAERVTAIVEYREGPTPPAVLRIHAAFALGVAARCCRLLGPTRLDEDLTLIRTDLDRLDPATIHGDRAAAGELALRAAAALMVDTGSRSLLLTDHGQRLAREALFVAVYALRPDSRAAMLSTLTGASG